MNQRMAFRFTMFGHVLFQSWFSLSNPLAQCTLVFGVALQVLVSLQGEVLICASSVSSAHFAEGKGCFHHSEDVALTRVRNEGGPRLSIRSPQAHVPSKSTRAAAASTAHGGINHRPCHLVAPRPQVRDRESVPSEGRSPGRVCPRPLPEF